MRKLLGLALSALCTEAASAQSADSAAFIIRLGHDTTAIERYVRTAQSLVAEAVQRSPSTVVHRMTLNFAGHAVSSAEWVSVRAGETQPLNQRTIRFSGDSAVIENTQGGSTRTQRVAAADAVPLAGPFYFPYELAMMRTVASGARSHTVRVLPGGATVDIRSQRVGNDSIVLNNQFAEPMRARIDARGRLLNLRTPAYATVERVGWLELNHFTREFAARDAAGQALGMLSPRATVRQRVQGANVWLDYSRPLMRGRPIWGGIVPLGQVWRMGANDAAHIAIDRTIEIGSITVAPGTYTLFLLPEQGGWQLIVNRATGMSGLDYDAAQDLGRLPLTLTTLDRPVESFTLETRAAAEGGTLVIAWDRTQAAIPFRVR